MAVEETEVGLVVEIPLAGLTDAAAGDPIGWRHGLEDRSETAIVALGAKWVGGGTMFGESLDFQISVPAGALAAAYAQLGVFLAQDPSVPDGTVLRTYPYGADDMVQVTIGALRGRA